MCLPGAFVVVVFFSVTRSLLPALFCLIGSVFLSSCESTLDYGYYVSSFDDDSIVEIFQLSDAAIANRDIRGYSSFFGPGYTSVDRTSGGMSVYVNRSDYLTMVDDLFDDAKTLRVITRVMDIEYAEPGRKAIVTTQEEEYRELRGDVQHYTSIIEVEVGFEEGWIYFLKSTRTAMQVIEE